MMDRRVAVVVEDDDDIRELLSAVLGQSGFDVHEASGGREGVETVRAHDPAVVTVDLGLQRPAQWAYDARIEVGH